ncbi:MAG TPA: Fe-S cluster assembly protein SufD [Burkholderiales bacterium]|nr:Fe-S cluster assembly protein SufD [Burkholderiales bacterium]
MDAVTNGYVERLLQGQGQLPASPLSWLNGLRAQALERANALTVPTTRDEDWRFTDLSPLYKAMLEPSSQAVPVDAAAIEPWLIPEADNRLVFVDGAFAADLSALRPETGVVIAPLASALKRHGDRVQAELGRLVPGVDDAFSAVNTAWLRDGAAVLVDGERDARRPIHLMFVSARAGAAVYPRALVVVGRGSRCMVIEDFVSIHQGAGLTNGVTEIHVGENASVRHIRLQRESAAAFHIATCGVRVARDGRYSGVSVSLGARISRYNLQVVQAGEGTDFQIDGLALVSGRQLADTHSFLDHALPHGRSRQLHKCVAGGAGHAVFNGKVLVRRGAQRTDSAQESRNLLLTERAHVDTKPQLEIFADDVKCAHGATVGQLDAEQVFYLRSRGLSDSSARDLLTFAFAAQIVERIALPSVVKRLEDVVRPKESKESR